MSASLKARVSTYRKLNNGQKLKIRIRETSKVFNRIPLLALVNNRTRQNDGRISPQKQTSNDERQSNLTKLGMTMLFVSEKVLLFDPESFRRQEEGLDGGISKTLNTKILPSITSNIKILGCLTSNTKKFSETLKLIQM